MIELNKNACVVITGLPGSGKTHLVNNIKKYFPNNYAHINADWVRDYISNDLKWSIDDKLTQAIRIGIIANSAFINVQKPRLVVVECFSALKMSWSCFLDGLSRNNINTKVVRIHMETIPIENSKFFVPLDGYERPNHSDILIEQFPSKSDYPKIIEKINSLIKE